MKIPHKKKSQQMYTFAATNSKPLMLTIILQNKHMSSVFKRSGELIHQLIVCFAGWVNINIILTSSYIAVHLQTRAQWCQKRWYPLFIGWSLTNEEGAVRKTSLSKVTSKWYSEKKCLCKFNGRPNYVRLRCDADALTFFTFAM